MNNQGTNNQSVIIEDLSAQNTEEIKGGPKKIFIGCLSVNEAPSALLDLEPSDDIKAGMQLRSKRTEAI